MAHLTNPKPVGLIGVSAVVCRSSTELIVDAPATGIVRTNTLRAAVKEQCESKLALIRNSLSATGAHRWAIPNITTEKRGARTLPPPTLSLLHVDESVYVYAHTSIHMSYLVAAGQLKNVSAWSSMPKDMLTNELTKLKSIAGG